MGSRYVASALMGICAMCGGCGSSPHNAAPSPSQVRVALTGSPPPLAQLHAQANRLLAGGPPAFQVRLAGLRGFPVVVNKWASWCGPCRSEFPAFQRAAVSYGRQVAFLGLNGKADSRSDAAKFLRGFPVTYPSYEDANEDIARTIEASTYDPLTVFLDRRGKIQFVHAGAYTSAGQLMRDIRLYALRAQ